MLKRNDRVGSDLAGLPYKDLKRWSDYRLPDKRTVPMAERRIKTSWRLKPSTIIKLKKKAKAQNTTETEIIEKLIEI